jgi:hypothetical protein
MAFPRRPWEREITRETNEPGNTLVFTPNEPGNTLVFTPNEPGNTKVFTPNEPGNTKVFTPNEPGNTKVFTPNEPGNTKVFTPNEIMAMVRYAPLGSANTLPGKLRKVSGLDCQLRLKRHCRNAEFLENLMVQRVYKS